MFKPYTLIEPIQYERDELGTPLYRWYEVGKINGMMDFQSGDNRNNVHQTYYPDATHVFVTHGFPSYPITVFHKLISPNGIEYTIHYVDNVGEVDDHLEIYCEQKGSDRNVYF